VLGVGEVAEEDQEVEQVLVPEDGVEGFRRSLRHAEPVPDLRDAVGEERPLLVVLVEEVDLEAVDHDVGDHQPKDEEEDDPGVVVQREALWTPDEALEGGHGDAGDDEDVEDIHRRPHKVVPDVAEVLLEANVVVYSVQ